MDRREILRQLFSNLAEVKSAYKTAIDLIRDIEPEALLILFEELKRLCPSCENLESALRFYIYLPEELKETADKVIKLMELWRSGRLMLDLDAIFNMINGGNHKKPGEPKPYKGFWSIIIMLSILLKEV